MLVVVFVLAAAAVGAIILGVLIAMRQPPVPGPPSPRPRRDEGVAVLEGGSERGWSHGDAA